MSSPAQIAANIANAHSSTGPRTEEGKTNSSKNAITLGLFATDDFVRPNEQDHYQELNASLLRELAPVGVLENNLVVEIRRAMWRLHRCGQVESNLVVFLSDEPGYILDPMETNSPHAEKVQKSLDRARSQAHRLLHKSTAELRRLQTDRQRASELDTEERNDVAVSVTRTTPTGIPVAKQTQPMTLSRNSRCPCNSGLKYKRCCGQSAPLMSRAA